MQSWNPSAGSEPGIGVYFYSNNESRFEAAFTFTIHKFDVTWKEFALELTLDLYQVAPEGPTGIAT